MLAAKQGQMPQAWADLMAARRLARLISQGPKPIQGLWGLWMDESACTGCEVVLTSGKLTPVQVQACLADLTTLPAPTDVRKSIANNRFATLDAITLAARSPQGTQIVGSFEANAIGIFTQLNSLNYLEWNHLLRLWNEWCDRREEAISKKNLRERHKAREEYEEALMQLTHRFHEAASSKLTQFALDVLQKPEEVRKRKTTIAAACIITLCIDYVGTRLKLQDTVAMRSQLLRVTAALAAYEAQTGRLPTKLADLLAPKYINALPQDIFSGKPLIYKLKDKGCVIYSVGPNFRDDDGLVSEEDEDNDEKDDIAVRFKR